MTAGQDVILEKTADIIRDLFDEYRGPVTRNLTADQVPQWDSLANIQLVVLVEQAFAIRFNSNEIRNFRDLGDLIDNVARKRSTP